MGILLSMIADILAFFKLSANYRYQKNTFGDYRKTICMEFIERVFESRYIGHFLIIGQIIGIDLPLPSIIGDFDKLSATLSI